MERIKLKGVGGIILKGEAPQPDKDYLVAIRCALEATTTSADVSEPDTTYIMTYLVTESVQEIGTSNMLKVQKGKTKSQQLRHLICSVGKQNGEDPDEYYDRKMDELIADYDNRLN